MSEQELLGRERRFAPPVAVAIVGVIGLELAGFLVLQSASLPTGSRLAPVLRAVDPVSSKLLFAAIMRGAGFALMAIPLAYLFKAASAREDGVRSALLAAVVGGPIFLAISLVLQQAAINDAASQLVGKLPLAHPEAVASDLQSNSTLLQISLGMALAGTIGFLAGTVYTSRRAMQVGLLTRFWGNLGAAAGMILGLATLIPALALPGILVLTVWLVYLLLVILDRAPGGSRPPAWDSGEAVAWEVPERGARGGGLFGGLRPPVGGTEDQALETTATETTPAEPVELSSPARERGERRKRKRRQ